MAITKEIPDEVLKDYQKPEDLLGQSGLLQQLSEALIERKVINLYILLRQVGLACALFFASPTIHGQDIDWPQFRGPNSNPVGAHTRLAERWSKTENVEWSQEIPGRGW